MYKRQLYDLSEKQVLTGNVLKVFKYLYPLSRPEKSIYKIENVVVGNCCIETIEDINIHILYDT